MAVQDGHEDSDRQGAVYSSSDEKGVVMSNCVEPATLDLGSPESRLEVAASSLVSALVEFGRALENDDDDAEEVSGWNKEQLAEYDVSLIMLHGHTGDYLEQVLCAQR